MQSNLTFHTVQVGMQNFTHLLENCLGVFNKVKHILYHMIQNPILRYLHKRNEKLMFTHTQNCMWMLIVVLFIIAQNWEENKWPSGGECYTNWYIHTIERCSAIKRNRLLINRTMWVTHMCSAKWKETDSQG